MVNDLIYVSPESEGIGSDKILKFIELVQKHKINLHSFMFVKSGNIIAEGYYKPFKADFKHRIYSASKSFVALAVGKAIGDGKLKLTDKLVDLFPEYPVADDRAWLKDTTVEDALMMSVPMFADTYYSRKYKDWAWTFFNIDSDLKPAGTVFSYNTSATFILDVLVEKITGMTFLEYLRPVFEKIGVADDIWCVKSPDGYSWGGSGVLITMRDFAKVGELVMHRGNYKGEQLLPLDYMTRATSAMTQNLTENFYFQLTTTGYGYQFWINENGYSLYGMGSQLVFCFPDKDFMFVCNGDTQSSGDYCSKFLYDVVSYVIYDNIQDKPLPENEKAYKELTNSLNNLELNVDFGPFHSDFEKKIEGVKYDLIENKMGWKWFKFNFEGDEGVLTYENDRGEKQIRFGLGKYVYGTFPETHYYDKQVDTPANRELDAMFSANWIAENKILVRNYITDTNFGNCFMTFGFKGDEVGVMFKKTAEFFMGEYHGFAGGKISK